MYEVSAMSGLTVNVRKPRSEGRKGGESDKAIPMFTPIHTGQKKNMC